MKLEPLSVPATGTGYSAFAAFDSNVTLAGSVDKEWYAGGSTATITATVGGSPTTATVMAEIARSDGNVDVLPLTAIGGGQYQGSYNVPSVSGYAEVRVSASGTTASSLPFERETSLSFQISPGTFTLNNQFAENAVLYPGLSRYEYLTVSVGVNATSGGKVGISADLVDGNGEFVAHSLAVQNTGVGSTTLELQFNGSDIFASRRNGPYTLTNITLTDENTTTLIVQEAQSVYDTLSYLYTDFIGMGNFADVPLDFWASSYVERLYLAGITGGCGTDPLIYCPEVAVNRAQMAVFLLRGKYGSSYTPPAATGAQFIDVPANYWAAAWIEQLAAEGITGGCGGGKYCPEMVITRDQMAVFLLRGKHGGAYIPPAVTGVFGDVPANHWAAAWIEQLANEGITGGCGSGNYCPTLPVSRDQMAVFLVRAFNLP